jgi:hypothetical protein
LGAISLIFLKAVAKPILTIVGGKRLKRYFFRIAFKPDDAYFIDAVRIYGAIIELTPAEPLHHNFGCSQCGL